MAIFMGSKEDRNVTVKEIYDYLEIANGELKIIGHMIESNDDKF